MRSSTRSAPMRVSLSATSAILTSDPSTSAAATAMNAAEEGSPGTDMSCAWSLAGPSTLAESPFTATGTPNAGSSSSVWSRLCASSVTVVVPRACSPASSIADFTCADACSVVYETAVSPRVGSMTSGSRPPSCAVKRAPIARSGFITRSIGRLESEASPCRRARTPRPQISPMSRRVVVPELPQSMSAVPCTPGFPPMPVIVPFSPCAPCSRSMAAPSVRIASSDEITSSLGRRFRRCEVPDAMPANSTARCESDLSDGTRILPAYAMAYSESARNEKS